MTNFARMGRRIFRAVVAAFFLFYGVVICNGQTTFSGVVRLDRTVHDWGDVTVKDGPLKCSFELENISDKPVKISSVVSSCGCTGVKWTTGEIMPGEKGSIDATYSNDEGPTSFDKTLTVKIGDIRKPLILHLRGVVHAGKLPLKETYPAHMGPLGFRSFDATVGNMSQGECRSSEITLANISKKPVKVSFTDISPFLTLSPGELTIAGKSVATLSFTVQSDRSLWGTNYYCFTPVVNGQKQDGQIRIRTITRENFDFLTKDQRAAAPKAEYDGCVSPDPVEVGTKVCASFTLHNKGRTPLKIYKADFDSAKMLESSVPESVAADRKATLDFTIDTSGMSPAKENVAIITLYTNDPDHSVINLYVDIVVL